MITVIKYGSEAWALRKVVENLLYVFQRNCLRILLGTRQTDRILNSGLYEKCGSIPLSRAIMKERLRWPGHGLRVKNDRLPEVLLNNNLILRTGSLIHDITNYHNSVFQ